MLKVGVRQGEMAEWSNAPVLKTGDPARDRGFESLSLRQNKCVHGLIKFKLMSNVSFLQD